MVSPTARPKKNVMSAVGCSRPVVKHEFDGPRNPAIDRLFEQSELYGKRCLSVRVPIVNHHPGYKGHVHGTKYVGGATYGSTTRRVMNDPAIMTSPRLAYPQWVE
jgi:hypothetical protein